MKTQRFGHHALTVDNSIYVFGGWDRDNKLLSSVEQFIPNDSRGWIALSVEMKQKRFALNSNFFGTCLISGLGF